MKIILFLQILVYIQITITGAEVCFRKYLDHKVACKGLMRRRIFKSSEDCCSRRKSAGYAVAKKKLPGSRNLYVCSPCSDVSKGSSKSKGTHKSKDKGWSAWSKWSRCSKTCEAGIRTRKRKCYKIKLCKGKDRQVEPCSLRHNCPVDGKWGPWFPWQQCSVSCGGGTQVRERKCSDPPPSHGGKPCKGKSQQSRSCGKHSCPVHGGWGQWTEYSACSRTCGKGVQRRMRKCDSPAPAHGGRKCEGRRTQKLRCYDRACPIDGGWSLWSGWTQCTVSCGNGHVQRTRSCDSPKPAFGGKPCEGESTELRVCQASRNCPIHGGWSEWTSWGDCLAKPCSDEPGHQIRSRSCTNPRPQYGGKYCMGRLVDRQECSNNETCAIDGGWCDWDDWSPCSEAGGYGFQSRTRSCQCPLPSAGGEVCSGEDWESRPCGSTNTYPEEKSTVAENTAASGCSGGSGSGSGSDNTDGSDVNCDQEGDSEE